MSQPILPGKGTSPAGQDDDVARWVSPTSSKVLKSPLAMMKLSCFLHECRAMIAAGLWETILGISTVACRRV